MALIPLIQPPIMRLLTTDRQRKIKMVQTRRVSKTERIIFPVMVTIFVALLLPDTAPLVGSLMLGNLLRETGCTDPSRITELLDTDNFSRLNVARIRNYIQQNIADVTRSAIAEHFYFSPNYLSKLFRNVEGVSLINYIQYQRIERAKSLLTTTDLSISEVAMEIGYPNFSHFSKRFQNLVGCSPNEYRRKARSAIQKGPNK